MYKLTVVSGPNRGSSFPLKDGDSTIGRQDDNVIVLKSSKISRIHCILKVTDDGVILEDQGSANGTFVNGIMIKAKSLQPGDKFSVGEYVLEIRKAVKRSAESAPPVGDMRQ
mgnify:CR=1 FL=1